MRGVIVVALAASALFGCGGGGSHRSPATTHAGSAAGEAGEAENEARERERNLSRIPTRDRDAYFKMASVIGVLNKDASLLAVAHVMRRRDTAALPRLRRRIVVLRPRDSLLVRLRGKTLATIDQAIRTRRSLRTALNAAPAMLKAVAGTTRGLTRYARAHPSVGELVPD